jgi:hypothetical protein
MGFPDDKRNLTILKGENGNVDRAVATLIRLGEGARMESGESSPAAAEFGPETPPKDDVALPTKSNPFDRLDLNAKSEAGEQLMEPVLAATNTTAGAAADAIVGAEFWGTAGQPVGAAVSKHDWRICYTASNGVDEPVPANIYTSAAAGARYRIWTDGKYWCDLGYDYAAAATCAYRDESIPVNIPASGDGERQSLWLSTKRIPATPTAFTRTGDNAATHRKPFCTILPI